MAGELTEDDYIICMKAVTKCQLLRSYTKSGLKYTVTSDNFGFTDMTDEQELELIEKLELASRAAWLRDNRG